MQNEQLGLPGSQYVHLTVNSWSLGLLPRKAAARSLQRYGERTSVWLLKHQGLHHYEGITGHIVDFLLLLSSYTQ